MGRKYDLRKETPVCHQTAKRLLLAGHRAAPRDSTGRSANNIIIIIANTRIHRTQANQPCGPGESGSKGWSIGLHWAVFLESKEKKKKKKEKGRGDVPLHKRVQLGQLVRQTH